MNEDVKGNRDNYADRRTSTSNVLHTNHLGPTKLDQLQHAGQSPSSGPVQAAGWGRFVIKLDLCSISSAALVALDWTWRFVWLWSTEDTVLEYCGLCEGRSN